MRTEQLVWTNKLKLERQQLPAPPVRAEQFEALRHRTTLSGRRVEFDFYRAVLRVARAPEDAALACTPARRVGPPISQAAARPESGEGQRRVDGARTGRRRC